MWEWGERSYRKPFKWHHGPGKGHLKEHGGVFSQLESDTAFRSALSRIIWGFCKPKKMVRSRWRSVVSALEKRREFMYVCTLVSVTMPMVFLFLMLLWNCQHLNIRIKKRQDHIRSTIHELDSRRERPKNPEGDRAPSQLQPPQNKFNFVRSRICPVHFGIAR